MALRCDIPVTALVIAPRDFAASPVAACRMARSGLPPGPRRGCGLIRCGLAHGPLSGLPPGPLRGCSLIRSGFAAGCEAGLRPAVHIKKKNGLGPSYGLWPKRRASPNEGHSPALKSVLMARQSLATHPAAKPERGYAISRNMAP